MAILKQRSAVFPLAICAAVSFFFSRNHHYFSRDVIAWTCAAALVAGVLLAVACYAIVAVAGKIHAKMTGQICFEDRYGRLLNALFGLIGMALLFALMRFSWERMSYLEWSVGIALSIVLFITVVIAGVFPGNVIMAVFILISCLGIAKGEYENSRQTDYDATAPAAMPIDTVLKNRPNIYYFYLESAHDRDTLKSEFGFDAPEFFEKLEFLGFSVGNGISNYPTTLASMGALFNMRHHYMKQHAGLSDATRNYRVQLAYSNVLRILKHNGYSVNLLGPNAGLIFRYSSPYIDYVTTPQQNHIVSSVLGAFAEMNQSIAGISTHLLDYIRDENHFQEAMKNWQQFDTFYGDEWFLKMHEQFNAVAPKFVFIHSGFHHSPFPRAEPFGEPSSGFSEIYEGFWASRPPVILDCIEKILKSDPNAVIVGMGDHGALKYGLYDESGELYGERAERSNKKMRAKKLSIPRMARNLSSVLYFIRLPGNIHLPEFPENGLSQVNFFPFLFSVLNGTRYNAEDFERNLSFYHDGLKVMAVDGKYLDEWVDTAAVLNPGKAEALQSLYSVDIPFEINYDGNIFINFLKELEPNFRYVLRVEAYPQKNPSHRNRHFGYWDIPVKPVKGGQMRIAVSGTRLDVKDSDGNAISLESFSWETGLRENGDSVWHMALLKYDDSGGFLETLENQTFYLPWTMF